MARSSAKQGKLPKTGSTATSRSSPTPSLSTSSRSPKTPSPKSAPAPSTQSEAPGIYKLDFLSPTSLSKAVHDRNWRKHPQRQRQAFQALKSKVGYADAIIFNELTGRILDGHMRLDEAIKAGEATIPVLIGRWTEEQELLLLEKKDLLTSMAETNAAALDSLVAQNQKTIDKIKASSPKDQTKSILSKLNKDISLYSQGIADGSAPRVLLERKARTWKDRVEQEADAEEEYTGIKEVVFKDDVIFPSDFPWGIPPLRDDLLVSSPPTWTWNRLEHDPSTHAPLSEAIYCYSAGPATFPSREKREGGFLGFYTEDFRFSRAWDDSPEFVKELLAQDWSGVLLPDFSQYSDWPAAINLHNLYKSRWCGRYWQEAGISVLPILQGMGDLEAHQDLVLATLPSITPIVAVQCRTGNLEADYWQGIGAMLDLTLQYLEDLEFIVIYGGTDNRKYLEGHLPAKKGLKYVYLESFLARRRKIGK